jgi:hypothetical protein
MANLKAGYARQIISPPKGIYLIGYGDRLLGNRGINDDLTATALTLGDGRSQVVIISCDLLAINEITMEQVEKVVKTRIILCCSHTHSGPIVYADKHSSLKNLKYSKFLISKLIEVIKESQKNLEPVSLSCAYSSSEIAVNRREHKTDGSTVIGKNPGGIVDRSIGILQARNIKGQPLVTLVNFACHNVVLGPKNLLVSADWAGSMRRKIENSTGTTCLFIQGAAADLNPDHEWGDDDFTAVEQFGNRVANQVSAGLDHLTSFDSTPINYIKTKIWLPLDKCADTELPPKIYKSILSDQAGIPKFMIDKLLNTRFPWKTEIKNLDGVWSIPLVLTVAQFGELLWVGMGAEVFNEIGIRIKKRSPSKYTIFSSLTNGCIGYLPTSEEQSWGGYEVDLAPYFYRLPGKFKRNIADTVIDTAGIFLHQIRDMTSS